MTLHATKYGDQSFIFCFLNFCSRQLKFYLFSSSEEGLPVMVWFHGGGYTSGDSSSRLYGPEYLLDKDVILVTSNYRLGIFGFLTLGKVLFLIFSSFVTLMLWFIWWGQLKVRKSWKKICCPGFFQKNERWGNVQ